MKASISTQQYQALEAENAQLRFELAQLKKLIFGARSERFVPHQTASNQLQLGLDLDASSVETTKEVTMEKTIKIKLKKRVKKQPKRLVLPPHLPRINITLEPQEDVTGWRKIGEEITEVLDYVPAKFQVLAYIRPKYVRPQSLEDIELVLPPVLSNTPATQLDVPPSIRPTANKASIVIADLPQRPIPKGIPSPGLLTHIIISKFVDHLPYYRQIQQFHRIGVALKASTMVGWVAQVCLYLEVLYDKLGEHMFAQQYLQADETTIKVITKEKAARNNGGKGKTHTGYFWVYLDPLSKCSYFKYDPGRGQKYPVQHLKDFSGKLQTDGYKVYDAFDLLQQVTLVGCLAHVRRKFVDAKDNDEHRANTVLSKIQQLYKIEAKAREENYSHQQRYEWRQQQAKTVCDQLKAYFLEQIALPDVFPKSPIYKAFAYAINRWKYIERYLEDGQLEIDNNLVENAIRPVALGRKNYLFTGSPRAAHWAAIIYSLLRSAAKQGHNPFEYLQDVITRLPDTPMSKVEELLPHRWTAPVPQQQQRT